MNDKKKALILTTVFAITILSMQQSVFAETEKGKDFDRVYLGKDARGGDMYSWVSHPDRLPVGFSGWDVLYADYRLTEDSNFVYLETANAGSVAFSKSGCYYDYYNGGIISGNTPQISGVSWTVKGKANNTSTWSNLNTINNAACVVSHNELGDTVKITGQKQNSQGTFQIVLDYSPGKGIKETMRGYNNNPAWTAHNIGFTETFIVPRTIQFGAQQYDLANYNNTVLSRAWIQANEAKMVKLTEKIKYDVGLGFDSLNDIKITYINGVPRLSFNYLYTHQIVPYQTWFEVDPTFGYTSAQSQQYVQTGSVTNCLTAPGSSNGSSAVTARVSMPTNAAADVCVIQVGKWIISSIPDSATVTAANFRHDRGAAGGSANERMLVGRNMTSDPQTTTSAIKYQQGTQGNFVISPWTESAAGTNDIVRPFNSNGTTSIQNRLVSNWYGLVLSFVSMKNDASTHNIDNIQNWELQINYTLPTPNAVTDLVATPSATSVVYLSWTAPDAHGGTIDGYQINATTPFGNPLTILISSTGTTATTATVSGLTEDSPYSFRVSAIIGGTNKNITGANIANATTGFNSGNFTIGSFNLDATNSERVGVNFVRSDVNSTRTNVSVIYDKDYTLDCNVAYSLAQDSDSYYNVSGSVYSTSQNYHTFTFNNPENDIITMNCHDRTTNDTGNFVMNQNEGWILKQMVNNFRNGVYGTSGQFGTFDLITIVCLMFGMIGLNRTNEAVGAIIMLFALGILAYFGFIIWPVAFVGGIALIIVAAIAQTRKD